MKTPKTPAGFRKHLKNHLTAICVIGAFLIGIGMISFVAAGWGPVHAKSLNAERPAEILEKSYFSTWLHLREIRRFDKVKDFLQGLTEEENVVAVKQAYNWLIEQKRHSSDKEYEAMAFLAIRDFAHNYFKGYPNRNPKPFLEMIEDSSLDNLFRLRLIKYLDRASGEERAYFQAVFD